MKIFLDTANLDEIKEIAQLGILDGVTTNPSLMAKEGVNGDAAVEEHYREIAKIIPTGVVNAEVISTDFDGMTREGHNLASLNDNISVKVPMTEEGIKATTWLRGQNIPVNCTLTFSPAQALLAAKAKASYVSPFIGRLDDISNDGVKLIREIRQIYDQQELDTEILAASIRRPLHVVQCAKAGADIATCPYEVVKELFKHPKTDEGLEKFLKDHADANKD